MFWPDTGTGVDVEPARKPVAAAVRKFFTEGGVGVPPTVPGGDWFNQITSELLNVLAAAGIDPSKADDDQLREAISILSEAPASALRELLSSDSGSENIGFGTENVLSILSDQSVTPESQGASGDGIQNDQAEVESAIQYANAAVHLKFGSRYLVNGLNNELGKPLRGPGHIVKSVTGGLEAQTTYADDFQRITGHEYLAAWFHKLWEQFTTPTRALKIVFSGDSTTEGVGVSDGFRINQLVQKGLISKGLQTSYGVSCVNRGHSGSHTGQWDVSYVSADIADNADLYVIRWGINDPGWLKNGTTPPIDSGQSYPGRRDVSDFAASLRSGLSKLRDALPFESTSILLMMPNSTYDIPNARDSLWYEQLRNVYVQAARDFNCAFIDTYAIFQDSRKLFGIMMDDPMPTSGRGIHPNDVMNSLISGFIVDTIAPAGLFYSFSKTRFTSSGGVEILPAFSLPPDSYHQGISLYRAVTEAGIEWPINGHVLTFSTADDTLLQFLFGFKDADRGRLKVRFGRRVTLEGQPPGWSQLFDLIVRGGLYTVPPASGFSSPSSGAMRVAFTGTLACFDGYLSKDVPAIVGAGTTVGAIPVGYTPNHESAYGVGTVWDGANFEQVPVRVNTTGEIQIIKATTIQVQRLYLNLSYDNQSTNP